MKKKIGIIGYGYVGRAMRRLFETHFEIFLYDIETHPVKQNVEGMDLIVICVPTPCSADGSCDTSIVSEVVSWVDAPLILIKSTVPPGTTDELSKKYNKQLHFSPEYIGEPSNFVPPWKYPDPVTAAWHSFVIVGGPRASEVLDYFATVMATSAHYVSCSNKEAELAKYMENAYFALKVAFCNEFFDIADRFGVDYKKLRELWLLDSRIDPDHTLVFRDKRGFGGKCLPKDLSAIVKLAEENNFDPILLRSILLSNEKVR